MKRVYFTKKIGGFVDIQSTASDDVVFATIDEHVKTYTDNSFVLNKNENFIHRVHEL